MGRRTRLVPAESPRDPSPVETVRPDPEAWKLALELAEGDPARIRVLGPDELAVDPPPGKGRARGR